MSLKCLFGHKWDGCKCDKCGGIRDESHDWSGCTCTKCGKARDEGHDWSKDCEKCAKCGAIQKNTNKLNECRCESCERIKMFIKVCKEGLLNEVELLIHNGADVNVKDNSNVTPLHWAAGQGHKDIVDILISKGADVNAKDDFCSTPLIKAAGQGHKDIVDILISNGADVNANTDYNSTPLYYAVTSNHKDIVDILISKGAEVNTKETLAGFTPLHRAADHGHRDIVDILISNGADVNALNIYGHTPLTWANLRGYKDIAELIFHKFCDQAVRGSTRLRIPISQITMVVTTLTQSLKKSGVPLDALSDLYNNSLLSVCPQCNKYCAGGALLTMDMMKVTNTVFTGNSGGFERMIEGRCLNYSCNSTEHELFWCPDLSPKDFAELNSRGIKIDPNIQRTRDHVWKPANMNKR